MFLAPFRHIMGNTKRFKFLLTNTKFLIPPLSTYDNSLETRRSSQLMQMQVPACFEQILKYFESIGLVATEFEPSKFLHKYDPPRSIRNFRKFVIYN